MKTINTKGSACKAAALAGILVSPSWAATVVADSVGDWQAAQTNGIMLPGGIDSPEQGHPDTAGTGSWFYYASEAILTTTGFSQQMVWSEDEMQYQHSGTYGIMEDAMSPPDVTVGGEIPGPLNSQRIWKNGEKIEARIYGNFTNLSGGGDGLGVQVAITSAGSVMSIPVSERFDPGGGESLDFDFTLILEFGQQVHFIVDPLDSPDEDEVLFNATVEALSPIPEPSSVLSLLSGLIAMVLFRKRR